MANDVLEVELKITDDNAEVVLSKNKKLLKDFVSEAEKAQPQIKFSVPNQNFIDLDKLEKRAALTRKSFEDIIKTRLDSGQVGFLTKELVKSSVTARQLQTDITGIKRELANPNRKSSIAFLTEELRAAEREADQLNRKLNGFSGNVPSGGLNGRGGANNLKLSSFQKTNLSYQVNDVVTGLASGQNPTQILAQQGGQIAQIFNPAQVTAFTAAYSGLVSILGAGAIAIAATYKITGDLRAEAERRLKAEESIQGAINRQIIGQREALANYEKLKITAADDRAFSRRLQDNSIEELKREKASIEQLILLTPANIGGKSNENFERLAQRGANLDAQIEQSGLNSQKAQNDSFNQRFETFRKNQQDAADFELRQAEKAKIAAEKREKDIEKAKQKIAEFGKTANSVFDNLFQKANANNPFALLLSESDKAAKDLKETLRGLSPELQATASKLQQKLNNDSLFKARLDNSLDAFDLRDQAENIRNPFKNDLQKFNENPAKSFNDFIEFQLKKLGTDFLKSGGGQTRNNRVTNADGSFGGFSQSREDAFTRYHSNIFTGKDGKQYTNGFSQSDARNDLFNVYEETGGFQESRGGKGFGNNLGGFFSRRKTFEDLTADEKRLYLADVNKTDTSNLSVQARLEKQLGIVDLLSKSGSDDQASVANRKIIELTKGVDPRSLTESQRDRVALAREKEADRLVKVEEEAKKERDADRKIRERLNEVLEKLADKAEKGGSAAVEVTIKNDTDAKTELKPAASAKDVQKAYDDAYTGGTFYDDYNKR